MTDKILPPINTPYDNNESTATTALFEKKKIWLPRLIFDVMNAGEPVIKNKTFVDCYLEGPAVLLAAGGVEFDGCDMGVTGGDVRNLLLTPVGPEKVIGPIAFQDCKFKNCRFFAVGFTGSPDFIQHFISVLSASEGPSA